MELMGPPHKRSCNRDRSQVRSRSQRDWVAPRRRWRLMKDQAREERAARMTGLNGNGLVVAYSAERSCGKVVISLKTRRSLSFHFQEKVTGIAEGDPIPLIVGYKWIRTRLRSER